MTRGFKKLTKMRLFQNERQNIAQDMTFQQVKQLRFNLMKLKW